MASKRRMFYNDDSESSIAQYRGPFRRQMVTDAVDVLLGTPITSLVFCVVGGDYTIYPSGVDEMPAWRRTKYEEAGAYRRRYEWFRFLREQGWDMAEMARERAIEKGLEFIPSMRMNDAHFGQKVPPTEHPLTGKFWMEHQELAIGPAEFKYWGNRHLLDFKHREVRDYRLAVAGEAIDRYGTQGFEMDWTRHYCFFKPGEEQPALLTEMVEEVRRRLDARAAGPERPPLIMRVPASITISEEIGLDAREWVARGLVDYLVPSSMNRYISLDMPVEEWAALVEGSGVEIHPSPDSAAPRGNGQASLEMYRAAAANYYAMGAHGFYFFNLFCQGFPLSDEAYVAMRDVSDPAALDRRDKLFSATPDCCKVRESTPALPLPITIGGEAVVAEVWIGDDLPAAAAGGTLRRALLRLRVDALEPDDRVAVTLNGAALEMDAASIDFPDTRATIDYMTRTNTWHWEAQTISGPGVWIEIELTDPLPRRGANTIAVAVATTGPGAGTRVTRLINVDMHVAYKYCGRKE